MSTRYAVRLVRGVRGGALHAALFTALLTALLTFSGVAVVLLPASAVAQEDGASTLADDDGSARWAARWADDNPLDPGASYNAGLRAAHADRLGRSVFYLERAHLLAPFDRQIQDARTRVQRELRRRRLEDAGATTVTEGEPIALSWWRFFSGVPPLTYALMSLALVWLLIALLVARPRARKGALRDAVTIVAGLSALGILFVATMWIGQAVTTLRLEPGVVVATTPRFRDAPDELSRLRSSADLSEGAIVLIRERREGWCLVELVEGDRVWVTADTVRTVSRRTTAEP